MGSHILGSGIRCSFFGIVPGSFQKVPEDSGGVRRSGNCSTTSNTVAWAVGGALALMGQGHQPPKAHAHGRGETLTGSVGECSNFKKFPTHTQDHGDA